MGRWQWAKKGMHSTREDPAIPLNGPEDAVREQESGEPAPSLALLPRPSTSYSRFLPPPQGQDEPLPHTICRSELSLRNRTGKIAGQNVRRK